MPDRTVAASSTYDAFWRARLRHRTEARSRERARAALALLGRYGVTGGRLLDVGCGPGWALEEYARAGFACAGIDVSPTAAKECALRGLDARQLDIEAASTEEILQALGGGFRVVSALETLEHLVDPLAALRRLVGLVERSGLLVVSLPNELHLAARLRMLLGRLPFGGHDDPHIRHFDLGGARRLIRDSGLRLLDRRAMSIVPTRLPLLRLLAAPGLRLFPGCLALAVVYLLGTQDDLDAS